MRLAYKINQKVYVLLKEPNGYKIHETNICKITIWPTEEATYEICNNLTFCNNIYERCHRENGQVLKFKTKKEAELKLKELNIKEVY